MLLFYMAFQLGKLKKFTLELGTKLQFQVSFPLIAATQNTTHFEMNKYTI